MQLAVPGGGDRPVAKEVVAMALPLASNDEKLKVKGLGRRFGFLLLEICLRGNNKMIIIIFPCS